MIDNNGENMVKKEKKYADNLEDLSGVGPATAEKLKNAGYTTLQKVAAASPHELAEIGEFGVENAKKAIAKAVMSVNIGYETGLEAFEKRKIIKKLTTGSKNLDELLGGGVETQAITEAYGKFSSGKSQVAFQLSVNAQLPEERGGLNGGVLFIDTEHTFRPDRIIQMAKAKDLDPEQVLANIIVARAEDSDHQLVLVDRASEIIKEHNLKLVIIDSLTSQFRSDYAGRGSLGERQQKLNRHMHKLQKIADENNVAVYVTNQVMDDPGMMFGDPTKPIGGNIIAHAATYRLYLRKSKDEKRIARLVDSPNLPEGECVFKVSADGVKD